LAFHVTLFLAPLCCQLSVQPSLPFVEDSSCQQILVKGAWAGKQVHLQPATDIKRMSAGSAGERLRQKEKTLWSLPRVTVAFGALNALFWVYAMYKALQV
jgi:hypothetical protein